jgi:hypothetical protein
MAARVLIEQGHEVVVHGRNDGRTRDALEAAAGARAAVTGDLSTIAGARTDADQVNKLGKGTARLRAVRIRSKSRRPNRPTRLGSIALATGRVERRLAAILAADVAGYSRLMETDEEGTLSPAGGKGDGLAGGAGQTEHSAHRNGKISHQESRGAHT